MVGSIVVGVLSHLVPKSLYPLTPKAIGQLRHLVESSLWLELIKFGDYHQLARPASKCATPLG
ncbi:hypothetical protein [Chamaesiphon sp. OTE_75_metabat_556]|uniref:hypothetical protein n=1 Tax=Chamaesiphon sp. OTE_75_metabat_556 TaxID=2964692 RepID=UPI00286B19D0|nr:hypothetical protein [Chamaesiphon sp. OTE_75_metabat_556]